MEDLVSEGKQAIDELMGRQPLNFDAQKEQDLVWTFFNNIESVFLKGPDLILGKIYDEIGFDKMENNLFKQSPLQSPDQD